MEQVRIIGIDLAKQSFQLHGARADGSVAFRKKLGRTKMLGFLALQPHCLVVMEACAGAHYWGREIGRLGHEVKLVPPVYVKPFVKRHKNDEADAEAPGRCISFTSSILPRYLMRSKSMGELLPWLYLKGISNGDFGEALAALLGPDAPGLTSGTIGRLKALWCNEYEVWRKRDLSSKRYVYFWADGVYFSPRMEDGKQCVLVIIGADERGHKNIDGVDAPAM